MLTGLLCGNIFCAACWDNYICLSLLELNRQMLTGLLCGHKFCAACWDNYLTTKIVDEGMGEAGLMFSIINFVKKLKFL